MKLRYGRLSFASFIDETVDRTLRQNLSGDDYDALTAGQLIEMSEGFKQQLVSAIEGYDLSIPPSREELALAQAADTDEGRWKDGLS